MQRTEDGFIIISCDFCGTDWDEVKPMIEGHHGSIVCLTCFERAFAGASPGPDKFSCTMCLRDLPADTPRWRHPERPASANPVAAICEDCIDQAAGAFHKDPDVPWSKPAKNQKG
jgi:ClpX C4-type zinc finger